MNPHLNVSFWKPDLRLWRNKGKDMNWRTRSHDFFEHVCFALSPTLNHHVPTRVEIISKGDHNSVALLPIHGCPQECYISLLINVVETLDCFSNKKQKYYLKKEYLHISAHVSENSSSSVSGTVKSRYQTSSIKSFSIPGSVSLHVGLILRKVLPYGDKDGIRQA